MVQCYMKYKTGRMKEENIWQNILMTKNLEKM